MTSPVRACLGARAADRHRAPRARLVARVVVERPSAVVARAGFESCPAAVELRARNEAEQQGERAVEISLEGLKPRAIGAKLNHGARSASGAVEARDRLLIPWRAVVGGEHRSQALAHVERAAQLGARERPTVVDQPTRAEPASQGARGMKKLAAVVALEVVVRVHERLDETELARRRLAVTRLRAGAEVNRRRHWRHAIRW